MRVITERIGKAFGYDEVLKEIKINAQKAFFDERSGAYSLTVGGEEFTVLGNSLAILSGLAKNVDEICEKIAKDEFSDCSLSMKCFQYDALLLTDKDKWQGHVLEEIRKDYKKRSKYE